MSTSLFVPLALLLLLALFACAGVASLDGRLTAWFRLRSDRGDSGQATAEYALVLLGAAAVALLLVTWATKTNVVGRLLDMVFGSIVAKSSHG